jgi:hypothetical protein
MKRTLFYLLPILLTLGAACSPKSDPITIPTPTGTFTGKFKLLTKNTTGGFDTAVKETITLKMTANYHFAVTGDTIKHAGSHGTFAFNDIYIQFNDSTFVASKPHLKTYLVGTYQYLYDGTNIKMVRGNSSTTPDTIGRYDLVRN